MIYKLKLTPIGNFFFGTERTFGEGTATNYLAKSGYFPQQTTILGMLRFELLKKNNQIPIIDKTKAEELIGKNSFNSKEKQEFGQIKRISPLFLQSSEEVFYISPRDNPVYYDKTSKQHIYRQFNYTSDEKQAYSFQLNNGNVESKKQIKPALEHFSHKEWYNDYFIGFNTKNKLLFEDVFAAHSQIGITKSYDNENKNKAFFKKTSYNLKKDLSFTCWAEFNTTISWQPTIVFMGAERSTFLLELEKPDTGWYDTTLGINNTAGDKIVLLSDSYVDQSVYEACDFAITSFVDFRNFESTLSSNFQKVLPKTNRKLNLIKKGSVFYTSSPTRLIEKLTDTIFQPIGYNAFMTI